MDNGQWSGCCCYCCHSRANFKFWWEKIHREHLVVCYFGQTPDQHMLGKSGNTPNQNTNVVFEKAFAQHTTHNTQSYGGEIFHYCLCLCLLTNTHVQHPHTHTPAPISLEMHKLHYHTHPYAFARTASSGVHKAFAKLAGGRAHAIVYMESCRFVSALSGSVTDVQCALHACRLCWFGRW